MTTLFDCICKICGLPYRAKCADSRVCPKCRTGERPKRMFWLQHPVLPFMVLAIVLGCAQAIWLRASA